MKGADNPLVPTKRFWALVALGIPFVALAVAAGLPWAALSYDILLVIAAWITVKLSPSLEGLRVSRVFDPVLSVRTQNKIVVKLHNDGPAPIKADKDGKYPKPMPGIVKDREYRA